MSEDCHHDFICKNCSLSFDDRIRELGDNYMGEVMKIVKERNFEKEKYK